MFQINSVTFGTIDTTRGHPHGYLPSGYHRRRRTPTQASQYTSLMWKSWRRMRGKRWAITVLSNEYSVFDCLCPCPLSSSSWHGHGEAPQGESSDSTDAEVSISSLDPKTPPRTQSPTNMEGLQEIESSDSLRLFMTFALLSPHCLVLDLA